MFLQFVLMQITLQCAFMIGLVGAANEDATEIDFYSFTVKDIRGLDVSLDKYRGMVSFHH